MHAIAMVHKMQRLALNNSSSMDVDEAHKCTTIEEEVEGEEEDLIVQVEAHKIVQAEAHKKVQVEAHKVVQQAYHAATVIRQMQRMALSSNTNSSGRSNVLDNNTQRNDANGAPGSN
uniref:Uncharacterized protein n=1 Tax=Timema poppense TaxID=170557 RepID=A0A7R9D034_TIMPO|nr:unnamed protein product [Timema poppensis]